MACIFRVVCVFDGFYPEKGNHEIRDSHEIPQLRWCPLAHARGYEDRKRNRLAGARRYEEPKPQLRNLGLWEAEAATESKRVGKVDLLPETASEVLAELRQVFHRAECDELAGKVPDSGSFEAG